MTVAKWSPTGGPFDWPAILRLGVRGLGLSPSELWSLTPAELLMLAGIEPDRTGGGTMTRARLDALLARFPDREPRLHRGGKGADLERNGNE